MKACKTPTQFVVYLTVALVLTASHGYLDTAEAESAWRPVTHGPYGFKIPETWKADADRDFWAPQEEVFTMGRPQTSLHVGTIPPIPGQNREELLAFYYGSIPEIVGKVNKCGMEGLIVEIAGHGLKHHGLILIEESGPMKLLNFFDCQCPLADAGKNQELFTQILDSVTCN